MSDQEKYTDDELNFIDMAMIAGMGRLLAHSNAGDDLAQIMRSHALALLAERRKLREPAIAAIVDGREPKVGVDPSSFPDGLVERLSARVARADDGSHKLSWQEVAAIFLSELAKAPVELPSWEDVQKAYHDVPPLAATKYDGIVNMIRVRLAPILAAKDASIMHIDGLARRCEEKDTRIAELDATRAAEPHKSATLCESRHVHKPNGRSKLWLRRHGRAAQKVSRR